MDAITTSFSTAAVPPAHRMNYWADLVCDTFVELNCVSQAGRAFYGRMDDRVLGDTRMTRVRSTEHRVERDRSRIARSSSNEFLISLQLTGTGFLHQDGRDAVLNAGDFALYDVTRPYCLEFQSEFEQLVMRVPRQMIADRLFDTNRVTAVAIAGDQGVGRLASMLLLELAQQAGKLDAANLQKAQWCTLDLVTQALGHRAGQRSERFSEGQMMTMRRILDYVERHLDDIALTCEAVARANGVSERYLRKLFSGEEQSLSEWIWRRRLERANNDLRNPALLHRSITSIAFRWGFKDSAHFSRAFRRQFGKSPREARPAL